MTELVRAVAPSVSVIIAAFADERWADMVQAVDSVLVQSHPAQEIIVVIDHNAGLFSRANAELSGVSVLENALAQGASGARNTGVAASTSEVVAFLDDDAAADPDWLKELISPFEQSVVIGVGGRLEPAWFSQRPRWFAPEFDWVVGASYRGMPEEVAPIRNVWSGNMAIRREVFDAIGGFRVGFGKTGDRSRPEDTDLCLRASTLREGTCWVFQPKALAHHKVPASREGFGFFVRRCYAEGQGKAELGALVDRRVATSSERAYARAVLPKGFIAGLGEAMRGDPMGLARSGVILLGLGAATAGMTSGRLTQSCRSVRSATAGSTRDPSGPRLAELGSGLKVPVRILVDQSGYDLLNLGDVAMLQACLGHLGALWPGAEIAVICHDPKRLNEYCPGTTPVPAGWGRPGSVQGIPERVRLGFGQVHKMFRPYTTLDRPAPRREPAPRHLTDAVRWADVVVASGGGYLNDTWWWHGFGVLSVLDLAQRLGKPTAMFGQGLGPLTHPLLWRQARRVLPRLHVLGLREGVSGLPLANRLGIPAARVVVTGDDALRVAVSLATTPNAGDALGVNARVTGYAGVDASVAAIVGSAVARVAAEKSAAVIGLPVSRYERDSDLSSIRSLWPGPLPAGSVVQDLQTPKALAAATAGCRAVVTGSYHAAVFALAAGVPTVCLSNSHYYNTKFAGIAELFPAASEVVPLTGPDLEQRLLEAIDRAWDASEASRQTTREQAATQAATSESLYGHFATLLNGEPRRRQRGCSWPRYHRPRDFQTWQSIPAWSNDLDAPPSAYITPLPDGAANAGCVDT